MYSDAQLFDMEGLGCDFTIASPRTSDLGLARLHQRNHVESFW